MLVIHEDTLKKNPLCGTAASAGIGASAGNAANAQVNPWSTQSADHVSLKMVNASASADHVSLEMLSQGQAKTSSDEVGLRYTLTAPDAFCSLSLFQKFVIHTIYHVPLEMLSQEQTKQSSTGRSALHADRGPRKIFSTRSPESSLPPGQHKAPTMSCWKCSLQALVNKKRRPCADGTALTGASQAEFDRVGLRYTLTAGHARYFPLTPPRVRPHTFHSFLLRFVDTLLAQKRQRGILQSHQSSMLRDIIGVCVERQRHIQVRHLQIGTVRHPSSHFEIELRVHEFQVGILFLPGSARSTKIQRIPSHQKQPWSKGARPRRAACIRDQSHRAPTCCKSNTVL